MRTPKTARHQYLLQTLHDDTSLVYYLVYQSIPQIHKHFASETPHDIYRVHAAAEYLQY